MLKNKLISSYKSFHKEKNSNKLNTIDLKIDGPARKIYISDYLTTKIKRLLFIARDFASMNGYKFCWPTTNAIYLKKRKTDVCKSEE